MYGTDPLHTTATYLKVTTLSPGESVFVSAASQPPVPVPVNTNGVPFSVWNTYLESAGSHNQQEVQQVSSYE